LRPNNIRPRFSIITSNNDAIGKLGFKRRRGQIHQPTAPPAIIGCAGFALAGTVNGIY
jgi:hypothetical protein